MSRSASVKLVYVTALIFLLAFVVVGAQAAPPLKYEKSSEVRMQGVIEEVKVADNNIYLTLKNEKGTLDVMVAPEKFLADMGISFVKGDTVEVLGSQLTGDNAVMLAREVTCKGDVMIMRDENGKPVWEGWSR